MQDKPSSAKPPRAKLTWTRSSARLLLAALLFSANLGVAQQAPQTDQPPAPQSRPSGVSVDPSAGPLTPAEPQPTPTQPQTAPLPNAPQPVPPPSAQAPATPPPQVPLGAAAAGQVRTAGGGASRPAGNAIAPVKQHQYRSLVIKLGAVAAAGIAIGTVYGLSRATSSTPPHSASAATR